ncbi:unnamed protein product [Microthlaspi erraticum]|uniref:DDT domain-containing protein n=1 Tax=Microthlaspi erraticum TaxID=1685480 RepID=A0A6D2KBM1_9BRAS|nr:unnamed protein product [Microthlaspi erraticum]
MTTELTNQILEATNLAVPDVTMDQIGATTVDDASVTAMETLDQTDPDVRVLANEIMDQIGDITDLDARVVANESMDFSGDVINPAGSFDMTTEFTNQFLEATNFDFSDFTIDQIEATDGASVTAAETLDQTEETTDPDVCVVAANESMDQIGDITNPDARVVANETMDQTEETTDPDVCVVAANESMDQIGDITDPDARVVANETMDQTEDTTDPDVRVVANESMGPIGDITDPDARVVTNESMDQTEDITNPAASFVTTRADGYCHQCRQRKEVHGSCVGVANNRKCPLMFCRTCLRRRYGEFVEQVVANNNWLCPKCRGKCNCGPCRKMNGLEPTGNIDHKVKAAGCDNVCEYLEKEEAAGKQVIETKAETAIALPQSLSQEEKRAVALLQSLGQEKRCAEENRAVALPQSLGQENRCAEENRDAVRKVKVAKTKPVVEKKEEVKLPLGNNSILFSGSDFYVPPQYSGRALQFLEFCSAFGKALDLKEGQAMSVVKEVVSGVSPRGMLRSTATETILQLLTVIVNDSAETPVKFTEFDERTWIKAIGECLSKSGVNDDDLAPEMFVESIDPYDEMNRTQRFKLLNILCDEALGTGLLRSVIENPEYAERKKEAKKRLKAAIEQKKQLKHKIAYELAIGEWENKTPLTLDQKQAILRKMDAETLNVFTEVHNATEMLENLRYDDPLRTTPVHVDHEKGFILWKFKCYKQEEPNILHQQIGSTGEVYRPEQWYAFTPEQKPDLEEFIEANAKKMIKRRRRSKTTANTEKTSNTEETEDTDEETANTEKTENTEDTANTEKTENTETTANTIDPESEED